MVKMAAVVVAVHSLIIVANAGYATNNNTDAKTPPMMTMHTGFYANIPFNVFDGEGYGCVPLQEKSH